MNRNTLERVTASLVVLLISIFMFGVILIFANLIFAWDIFPPFIEKVMYFLSLVFLVVILACTLINIMLNISRMAYFSEKIAEKMYDRDIKNHK